MSQPAPRPRQATFAAWLIIGGSVILVVTAWQRISSLHTLEVQEELRRVLSEPPFAGSGLGLDALKTTIRVLCMVAAGAATASTILGFQALRRSTHARLALTLLAPLVLIGGFATAGFFAPMVVAGVVMLWLQPSRDWFAGRQWLPSARSAGSAEPAERRADPFAPAPPREPTPEPPQTERSPEPAPHPLPFGVPLPPPTATAPSYDVRMRRPGALVAACVIVWVSSAVVTGFMLLLSLVMAVAQDDLFDELERQQPGFDMRGMSHAEIAASTYVLTGLVVVWSLAATVLAVLALRRLAWARTALAVCTGATGLLVLALTLVNPLLVVLLAATSVTLWLLLRADVNAWYRR